MATRPPTARRGRAHLGAPVRRDSATTSLRRVLDGAGRRDARATCAARACRTSDHVVTYYRRPALPRSGLRVPSSIDIDAFDGWRRRAGGAARGFDAEHERLFTFALDAEHELVTLRAVAQGPRPDVPAPDARGTATPSRRPTPCAPTTDLGRRREATPEIYDRRRLRAGHVIAGPAIITEMDSTTLCSPGHAADRGPQRQPADPPRSTADARERLSHGPHHRTEHRRRSREVEVDPVTLDIIENALRNARNEMDAMLFRTAMSPGHPRTARRLPADRQPRRQDGRRPVRRFIPGFLTGFDGTIEEGDMFLTSDPYSCGGAISHSNDWLVLHADLQGRPARRLGRDVRPHDRHRRQGAGLDADRRPRRSSRKACRSRR